MRQYNDLEEDALNFLRENHVAVLATCFDGRAHATSVYYDVDDDFNFYYLTKRNTQKNIHVAFDPCVALVVGTGPEHISVQARGAAMLLGGDDKTDALNRMLVRFTQMKVENIPIHTMNELKDAYTVAFKVIPDELIFMNLNCQRYRNSISRSFHKIINNNN